MTSSTVLEAVVTCLGEAFLVFGKDGRCWEFCSPNCEKLLEGRPSGRPLHEVLQIPSSERSVFGKWMRNLFAGRLAFEDLAPLGPRRYRHSKGRHIALRYFPLREEGQLKAVLLLAADRTEEIEAKAAAREKEKRANFILKAAHMGQALDSFFANADRDVAKIRLELADLEISSDARTELLSVIHTLKGEASLFALDDFTRIAQDLEGLLRRYASGEQTLEHDIREGLNLLQETLVENRMIFYEINIRSGGPDLAALREQRRKLVELITVLNDLSIPREIRLDLLRYGVSQPIGWFFSVYSQFAQDLALRTRKKVSPIIFENPDLPVYAEPYQGLFRTIVHLIRNSIDHGIEDPAERRLCGKPESGQIRFRFERCPDPNGGWFVRIVYEDDGRGINVDRIRSKMAAGKDLSQQEALNQIFVPAFSTKEEAGDLSGLGVGLSALKQECANLGGTVRVESEAGKGARFVIEIPDSYDQLINNSTKMAG